MATQTIPIEKGLIKKGGGVVVFDLEKYQLLEQELEQYRRKMAAMRNLKRFDRLAGWGREFAKKNKLTQKQILEND